MYSLFHVSHSSPYLSLFFHSIHLDSHVRPIPKKLILARIKKLQSYLIKIKTKTNCVKKNDIHPIGRHVWIRTSNQILSDKPKSTLIKVTGGKIDNHRRKTLKCCFFFYYYYPNVETVSIYHRREEEDEKKKLINIETGVVKRLQNVAFIRFNSR